MNKIVGNFLLRTEQQSAPRQPGGSSRGKTLVLATSIVRQRLSCSTVMPGDTAHKKRKRDEVNEEDASLTSTIHILEQNHAAVGPVLGMFSSENLNYLHLTSI